MNKKDQPCHLSLTLLARDSICPGCGHEAIEHLNYPANRDDPNYSRTIHGEKNDPRREPQEDQ